METIKLKSSEIVGLRRLKFIFFAYFLVYGNHKYKYLSYIQTLPTFMSTMDVGKILKFYLNFVTHG